MIYPKQNSVIFWCVKWYVKWLVSRHLERIIFDKISLETTKSILLIANHYSYLDGLILYVINIMLFKKKMHIMVLEETVKKEMAFKYAGIFSIKKNSRDMLASLDYAVKLLDEPDNLVLIYPQGKLYSNFVDTIHFEKGVLRIIKKAQGKFQLVFAAAFVQYFKNLKPRATVYLKQETVNYADKTINDLQQAYQQHYTASKLLQTEIDIEQ
jgi:1-acyl-sn-glycerol-3-phosphate acyltransferase